MPQVRNPVPQLFTLKDVSTYYGLSTNTVRAYIRAGILKPIPKPAPMKRDYYSRETVERVFGKLYEEA